MHLSHNDTTYTSRKPSSMPSAPIHQLEGEPTNNRAGTCHLHPPNTAASWHDWHVTAEHVNRDHRTSLTLPSAPVAKASPAAAQTPCPAPSHPQHGETPGTRWGPPRGTLVAPRFVSQQLGGRRQGAWGQGEGHRTPETGLRC